jgi:hypothetical protein
MKNGSKNQEPRHSLALSPLTYAPPHAPDHTRTRTRSPLPAPHAHTTRICATVHFLPRLATATGQTTRADELFRTRALLAPRARVQYAQSWWSSLRIEPGFSCSQVLSANCASLMGPALWNGDPERQLVGGGVRSGIRRGYGGLIDIEERARRDRAPRTHPQHTPGHRQTSNGKSI